MKRRKVLKADPRPDNVTRYLLSCGHYVTVLNDDGKRPPKTLQCKQCAC